MGTRGRVAYVESVAFASECHVEPGPGDGNLVIERLTCGHFFWQKSSLKIFRARDVAMRVGKRRRCEYCCGGEDQFVDSVIRAFDAAPEKQTFGEPW